MVGKVAAVCIGVLLVVAGTTFGLQGLGVIGGSGMSGKTLWAVVGPLLALVGVVIVVLAVRSGGRTTRRSS